MIKSVVESAKDLLVYAFVITFDPNTKARVQS